MYGLSFGAMYFDFGPRSPGQNIIFTHILKTTKGRDFISIMYRHIGNHIWAFVWCHDFKMLLLQISRKQQEIETSFL